MGGICSTLGHFRTLGPFATGRSRSPAVRSICFRTTWSWSLSGTTFFECDHSGFIAICEVVIAGAIEVCARVRGVDAGSVSTCLSVCSSHRLTSYELAAIIVQQLVSLQRLCCFCGLKTFQKGLKHQTNQCLACTLNCCMIYTFWSNTMYIYYGDIHIIMP